MPSEPMVYRIPEAKRMLGIGHTRIYELIACGALDARKLGGCTVITHESMRRFVDNLPPAVINMVSSTWKSAA